MIVWQLNNRVMRKGSRLLCTLQLRASALLSRWSSQGVAMVIQGRPCWMKAFTYSIALCFYKRLPCLESSGVWDTCKGRQAPRQPCNNITDVPVSVEDSVEWLRAIAAAVRVWSHARLFLGSRSRVAIRPNRTRVRPPSPLIQVDHLASRRRSALCVPSRAIKPRRAALQFDRFKRELISRLCLKGLPREIDVES